MKKIIILALAGVITLAGCKKTEEVEVSSVSLNKTTLTMAVGATETLVATISPEKASNAKVTWSTSDSAIVSVEQNGTLTAKAVGNATITATAGGMSDNCVVTVAEEGSVPAESVTLDQKTLLIEIGETETLVATVLPEGTTDTTVWGSDDKDVATVDQEGLVTAIGVGTATITATAGGFNDTCVVTVAEEFIHVTSVTLNIESITIDEAEEFQLEVTSVEPEDATDPSIVWSSSDEEVATVDQDGYVIAVGIGTATISATADGVSGDCALTVTPLPAPKIKDFYYDDGTWSTSFREYKDCVGIVFALNYDRSFITSPEGPDPANPDYVNLVVALDQSPTNLVWQSGLTAGQTGVAPAMQYRNGEKNCYDDAVVTANYTILPAINYCVEKGAISAGNRWYLGSLTETGILGCTLNGLTAGSSYTAADDTAVAAFNALIAEAGGTAINVSNAWPAGFYWSSSYWTAQPSGAVGQYFYKSAQEWPYRTNSCAVRAMLAFYYTAE